MTGAARDADLKIQIDTKELRLTLIAALTRSSMSTTSAAIISNVMTQAEINGSRSHGIQRFASYISSLRSGWVDGTARPQVVDRATGIVEVDARNGFAQVATHSGQSLLVKKAHASGVAIMLVRNSHHLGPLWLDVEPLADQGLIAVAMINSRSRMLIWGGSRRVLGTNPMAFACSRPHSPPLVWDQASSVMSQGEVLLHSTAGKRIPKGVGVDPSGIETKYPNEVLDGGALLPFGGAKGSSLAFMVEVLAAALTGASFGFNDRSAGSAEARTSFAGQFILAIEPHWSAGGDFSLRVEEFIRQVTEIWRQPPPIAGPISPPGRGEVSTHIC